MQCPYCNSTDVSKFGWRRLVHDYKQRYGCKSCGRKFTPEVDIRDEREDDSAHGPKILILDIETAPMTVYSWSLKTNYINPDGIISPTFMLCWAAKWMGDKHVMSGVLTSKEAKNKDDSNICKSIHKLLSEADLAIAYNGDRFDFRKLNYRFIINNLPPPLNYRTIDPIIVLRRQFGFDSNKLSHINKQLHITNKTETNFQLWKDCMDGDTDALFNLVEYNKNDVNALEQNYLKIRPWMKLHPNLGVYFEYEGEVCRICGSTNVKEVLDKYSYTTVGKYSMYKCSDCEAISTGRSSELSKEKRRGLIK